MYALSHGRYIGSHPSIRNNRRYSADYAEIQKRLFQLEDDETALSSPIVHFTFDLRRRGLHRFDFRFHDLTVRVKLLDIVHNHPAFLICVGMPLLREEYGFLAVRIGRLIMERIVDSLGDDQDRQVKGMSDPKNLLLALLRPGWTLEDDCFSMKVKRKSFGIAHNLVKYVALPFATPSWSQSSHLKFWRRQAGWPKRPMREVLR